MRIAFASLVGVEPMPFGTLVGIYGLWVLFSKETEQLFEAQSVKSVV